MKKLISVCALGLAAVAMPAVAQDFASLAPGARIPTVSNPLGSFGDFANTDALPTFPSRLPSLSQTLRINAPSLPTVRLPGLGTNSFGLELPSLSFRSPGASLRLDGLNPFGGTSFTPRFPGFNVGMPSFNPSSVLSSVPNFSGVGSLASSASSLFGSRKGKHTSTSLPFLNTRDAGDLTYKIEAVKICEAALKELKECPDNSAGGFKMMPFLYKLIKSVGSRQKGMVNGMLVLIVVPYIAALAASFGTSPTAAMDATFPGAKRGITTIIEQTLKKYGRIGGAMNIQNYANQITSGMGNLASLPGQAGNLGNLASQAGSGLSGARSAFNGARSTFNTASNGVNSARSGVTNLGSVRLGQFMPPIR